TAGQRMDRYLFGLGLPFWPRDPDHRVLRNGRVRPLRVPITLDPGVVVGRGGGGHAGGGRVACVSRRALADRCPGWLRPRSDVARRGDRRHALGERGAWAEPRRER